MSKPIQRGLIIRALPEVNSLISRLNKDGTPNIGTPNSMLLTPLMLKQLGAHSEALWLPNVSRDKLKQAHWIVNLCADADDYGQSMHQLAEMLDGLDVPVFNHPKDVLASRRDTSASLLQDIPGFNAPQCQRFRPKHPRDFEKVFEEFGFSYPVILRTWASQTGTNQILIENENDWARIHSIPWGGQYMFMTQWVDFSNENGDWVKARVVITPEKVGVRHTYIGQSWKVHAEDRSDERIDRELARTLNPDRWPHFIRLGEEIRKRIPLSCIGVDVGWKSESETVLFEANAAMSILTGHKTPEYRRMDFGTAIHRSEDQIWDALISVTGQPFQKRQVKLFDGSGVLA